MASSIKKWREYIVDHRERERERERERISDIYMHHVCIHGTLGKYLFMAKRGGKRTNQKWKRTK